MAAVNKKCRMKALAKWLLRALALQIAAGEKRDKPQRKLRSLHCRTISFGKLLGYLSLCMGCLLYPLEGGANERNLDWKNIALSDITYFHRDVLDNHPGAVNSDDPSFLPTEKSAYELARKRALAVNSAGGYFWLMKGYTASFNNGHIAVHWVKEPDIPVFWPGFITTFDDNNEQTVVYRSAASAVPLGATLLACDGVEASQLAQRNVGQFSGAWQLLAQRKLYGYRLFFDQSNPFIARPQRCSFQIDGDRRQVALKWRRISDAERQKINDQLISPALPSPELKQVSEDTWWLRLPSFVSSEALNDTLKRLETHRQQVLQARRLVIDLRGNSGGSSDYGVEVVRILWGDAAADATPSPEAVDFRASSANLEWWKLLSRRLEQQSIPASTRAWVNSVAANLAPAIEQGQPFYTIKEPPSQGAVEPAKRKRIKPRVYFFTDQYCISACLDAADFFHSVGAIQIGQETNGDTSYMDTRQFTLPSGLAEAMTPPELLRNRPRGDLETWKPEIPLPSNVKGESAIVDWVLSLPKATR